MRPCSWTASPGFDTAVSVRQLQGGRDVTNVANDRTVTITNQGLYKDLQIAHVEGTVYRFAAIETGRPFVASDGRTSPVRRGALRYRFLVDTLGDTDLGNDVFLGVFRGLRRGWAPSSLRRRFRPLRPDLLTSCHSANDDRRGVTRLAGRISEWPPR